jgi:hypothetical protein
VDSTCMSLFESCNHPMGSASDLLSKGRGYGWEKQRGLSHRVRLDIDLMVILSSLNLYLIIRRFLM